MFENEFDYIIVGAGLCGLALAKELSSSNKRILILERGTFLNKVGTTWDAFFFYDKHALARSVQGAIIYRVFGVGGTSVVGGGNAIEPPDQEIEKFGIDFRKELAAVRKEMVVNINGFPIGKCSSRIGEVANLLGYKMRPMPKFGAIGKCVSCGQCTLGCRYNAKWTALEFLKDIDKEKVKLVTNFCVTKVLSFGGKAVGVQGRKSRLNNTAFYTNKVILCAGGIGTPVILQASGVQSGESLFVDFFNVTYGIAEESSQHREVTMSMLCDQFYENEGFILSPLVDNYVSFLSNVYMKNSIQVLRLKKMLGIMTKIKDDSIGKVHKNGKIEKTPTPNDLKKLYDGSVIAKKILTKYGVDPKSIFVTKARGAHPGGTASLGAVIDYHFETKIKNLFVCDASILPYSLGIPPMLTLLALTKWFSKNVLEHHSTSHN